VTPTALGVDSAYGLCKTLSRALNKRNPRLFQELSITKDAALSETHEVAVVSVETLQSGRGLQHALFVGIDQCELLNDGHLPRLIGLLRNMDQEGQKVIMGSCLPPGLLLEEFARNDEI